MSVVRVVQLVLEIRMNQLLVLVRRIVLVVRVLRLVQKRITKQLLVLVP